MSPFKIPEPPYTIEGVMENLKRQFEGENESDSRAAAPSRVVLNTADTAKQDQSSIDWLERTRRIAPGYRIRSHRRLLRFFIDPIKRFLHWGTRPYVDLVIAQQEGFNQASAETHRSTLARLRGIEASLASVADSLAQLSRHQEKMNSSLQSQIDRAGQVEDAHYKAQEKLNASQVAVNRALTELTEMLRARHDLGPFFDSIPESKRLEMIDTTRGPFGEIWGRHHAYVDYFRRRPGKILDIGCGRGEFLTMLRGEGIEAWGCEIDPLMVQVCEEHKVLAKPMNALEAIQSVDDASLGGVFSSQVIEHMFPGDLLTFIAIARKKIAPGGVIVLESLNPQSLGVLAKSYYKDLDHKRAIDPDYLALLLEAVGFANASARRTMPFSDADRLPNLPEQAKSGLTPEAHRAIQTAIDKLNAAIWCEQDFHVFAEIPTSSEASSPARAAAGAQSS
jgi:2-polyprenyl-3-methyl-5-hydroxy-6-metoxy-1,4-benzoquinol methylase